MAGPSKKQKMETRKFQESWKLELFFTMPDGSNAKPTCLICNPVVSSVKKHDIKRHYESMHGSFNEKYPPGSKERKEKLKSLDATYLRSTRTATNFATQQEKASEASNRISWILNRKKKPFMESGLIKECLVETTKVMCTPEQVKKFEQIPLSDDTNRRQTKALAADVQDTVIKKIKKSQSISFALDESTDITDISLLAVFDQFLNDNDQQFHEEIAGCNTNAWLNYRGRHF